MTFDSRSLLRRLQSLRQQIAALPRHRESLQAARDGGDLPATICAAIDAERHLRTLRVLTRHIKAQVVSADGLGDTPESLSELVLRAVRMLVLAELGELRDAVANPPARARPGALCWGRFLGIDDLTSRARAELDEITAQWCGYCGMAGVDRHGYESALRRAHWALRELGTTSELAHFLDKGLDRADWTTLQGVCARMLTALTISIDAAPDALGPGRCDATGRPGPGTSTMIYEDPESQLCAHHVQPHVSAATFDAAIAEPADGSQC